MTDKITDPLLSFQVTLLGFSQVELVTLADHLTYAANRLQIEIEGLHPQLKNKRITFRQIARLLRWRTYFATLAQAVGVAGHGQPVITLSRRWVGPGRPHFLEFLRGERYRAEAAAYSITANNLHDWVKQDLVRALDIEARFYGCLLDQLTTPQQWPIPQPDGAETVALLFVSLPKALIH